MSMLNEAILINYKHKKEYNNTPLNAVGATTSTTLRTVTAHTNSNCKYVRKFGTPYLIKQVTAIEDPIDTDMTFKVYALDGTLLGSRLGGGAFVAGATLATAQGCYLEVVATGACTILTGITITTDVSALDFVCPAEVLSAGKTRRLYLSATTSTYYDSGYMYGGARHTPTGTSAKPYFHPQTADAALGGAFTIVTVWDSCTYEVEYSISVASTKWQAALGQTPTLTNGVGARVSREVEHDGNNLDTIYVGKTGSDITGTGTYQLPYLTIGKAISKVTSILKYINIIDNGTYAEDIIIEIGITIEPLYLRNPVLVPDISNECFKIKATTNPITISGITFGNLNRQYYGIYTDYISAPIGNITITAINNSAILASPMEFCLFVFDGVSTIKINKNLINNSGVIQVYTISSANATVEINKNNIISGGLFLRGASASSSLHIESNNNVINNYSSGYGIYMNINTAGAIINGNIYNNVIYDCFVGIKVDKSGLVGTINPNFRNMIVRNNGLDLSADTVGQTITESNYGTNSGFTIGAGCITTDPQFCKNTSPYKFGISRPSGAYRTDTSSDDMGAHFRMIEINNDNIEINGFNIDGQGQYNNAIYILDTADHTGTLIKWCSVHDFQGIAIDPYDNNVNTDVAISNCKIYNNGNGIAFSYGGNTVEESSIYNNSIYGIWADWTAQTFNHVVFYGNKYGIYFESNTSGVLIKNSVFSGNSLYGIYSEVNIIITYSDIMDAVSSNVDISDASNINVNPMFISLVSGSEDFNIQTIEGEYLIDSGLKDAGNDGYDIGCYKLLRSVANDSWRAHELVYNPRNIDFESSAIGLVKLTNGIAGLDTFAIDNKLSFSFKWNQRQYSDVTDRKKIQYLNGLLKRRAVETPDSETIIRLTFLKTQNLANGTGTIDAVAKTITDNSADFVEEEWRGFFVGVKYLSGTATGTISASGKTLAVSGSPGWTTNQWAGYFFRYGKYWYYIKSNTADTLTLSDPEDTLENESNISWTIEKYFKCSDCYQKVITVIDTADELPSGSYDYYIGFVEVRVEKPGMKWGQPRYFWQQENWKSGYSIEFQEV